MADQKVTQLTELTTTAAGDLLYIVDDPAGSPVGKKITVSNLLATASGSFWVSSGKTDSYASATTFTNSGEDTTTIYVPGRVLRFTQASVNGGNSFYGFVVESSFSTNTTVTVLAEFDLANEALTVDVCNETVKMMQYSDLTTVVADTSNPIGIIRIKEDAKVLGSLYHLETSPTGSASTCDVHKNGTTIHTAKPSIAASGNDSTYTRATTIAAEHGDEFTFFIDSVGSSVAGGSPVITTYYIPLLWANLT